MIAESHLSSEEPVTHHQLLVSNSLSCYKLRVYRLSNQYLQLLYFLNVNINLLSKTELIYYLTRHTLYLLFTCDIYYA